VSWSLDGEDMRVKIGVPPNTTAQVVLPGVDEMVGSGKKVYTVKWEKDARWPPRGRPGPQSVLMPDNFVP
jgi:alpha-L-rhamnosidase